MTPDSDPSEDVSDGDRRVFASAAARRSAAVRTTGLVVILAVGTLGLRLAVPQFTDPTWIQHQLATLGPFAPLAFIILQTIQVIVAPIPGQTLAGVGGYLFGTLGGTASSMLGVALGSTVVFMLTRWFGRPYVERVVDADALARWDHFVDRTGVPGLFALFLLPTFPDDLLCFVAGLTELRLGTFLVLVVVGRTPTFAAAAYAGTSLAQGAVVQFVVVIVGLTLASVVVYAARDRIVARLGSGG